MNEQNTSVFEKKQMIAIVVWLAIGVFCILVCLARNGQPVFTTANEQYLGFPRGVFRTQDRDVYIKQYKQGDLSVFHVDYEGDSYVVTVYPTYTNDEECYELDFSTGQILLYKGNGENLTPEQHAGMEEDAKISEIGTVLVHLYLKEYQHAGVRYTAVNYGIHFYVGYIIFLVQVFRKNENKEAEINDLRLRKKRKVWRVIGIIIMVYYGMGLLLVVSDRVPYFVRTLIIASHNGVY